MKNLALQQPLSLTQNGSAPIPFLRTCVLKSEKWAGDAHAFLEFVRAALPAVERNYLLPKDISFFQNALTNPTSDFVAVLFGTRLVGMAVLRHFPTYAVALTAKAVTCPQNLVITPALDVSAPLSTLQSVAVDPDFKGHHVGRKILDCAVGLTEQGRSQILVAQASASNQKGRDLFEKNGFEVTTSWTTDAPRVLLSRAVKIHPAP